MAETKNIATMASLLSDDLFGEFLWERVGPTDTNWACEDHEKHQANTHPSDVVFFYDNPYSLARTYVNCDLKSYASGSITKSKITSAVESLARSLSCAEKSAEWQKRFVHDHVNHEICGLLFVYNHDGVYDRDFKGMLNEAKPKTLDIPKQSKLVVLGPADIFWLNNVSYEINRMRGKGLIPSREQCQFFYPNLVRRANVQPDQGRAATLGMLTSPWIILQYLTPKEQRKTILIFYRRSGASVQEFLYLIDYLMHYQLIQADIDLHLRTLETDVEAAAIFGKAKQEYTEECENSSEIKSRLDAISYGQIAEIHTKFSEIVIEMDYA
jgi:hypothetical protein